MGKIQVYKEKTVLVKWTGDKIVIDVPFKAVNDMFEQAVPILKINNNHYIKTSAINERYAYNVTNEIEVWVDENYPEHSQQIMDWLRERRKQGFSISKGAITQYANEIK